MPYLIPFVNRELDVTIDVSSPRPLTAEPQTTPVSRNEAFLTALTGALRPDQFTADDRERLLHSHGQTTTEEVSRCVRNLERCVDLVVWPESEEDCQVVVTLAGEHGAGPFPMAEGRT